MGSRKWLSRKEHQENQFVNGSRCLARVCGFCVYNTAVRVHTGTLSVQYEVVVRYASALTHIKYCSTLGTNYCTTQPGTLLVPKCIRAVMKVLSCQLYTYSTTFVHLQYLHDADASHYVYECILTVLCE